MIDFSGKTNDGGSGQTSGGVTREELATELADFYKAGEADSLTVADFETLLGINGNTEN